MTNHAHLIAVFYDMNQATKFYMEIKKKVTDYYKKLLGLKKLNLWEENDSVCEILDLYAAMKQIAYLYSNPATANLVSSIDEYRLVNSWVAFNANISTPLTATHEKEVPWVRQPSITPIKSKVMTRAQDSHYYDKLISASRFSHKLISCLLYTSPSPRDATLSRMPSSA